MPITQEITEELNVLTHFKNDGALDGIKVHNDAAESLIAAAQRLYDKGLITQPDGGYLTRLGQEVVEHLQLLLRIMTSPHDPSLTE
jgi:uncharacterized protein (TIGR02647 family)